MPKKKNKNTEASTTATAATTTTENTEKKVKPLNKGEFVKRLVEHTYTKTSGETTDEVPTFASQAEARRATDAILATIESIVRERAGVTLTGYFSITTKTRAARTGVKVPGRDGSVEVRDLPERTRPKIRPGRRLVDAAGVMDPANQENA